MPLGGSGLLIADDDVTASGCITEAVTIVVMTAAGLALAAQNLDTVVALFGFLFKYLYASHAYHLYR
jgi:hypothetical protein